MHQSSAIGLQAFQDIEAQACQSLQGLEEPSVQLKQTCNDDRLGVQLLAGRTLLQNASKPSGMHACMQANCSLCIGRPIIAHC